MSGQEIIKDRLVEDVVHKIADVVQPDQIILFGSRARGDAHPDSDIDLLILYNGPLSKQDVKLHIRREFPYPDFSMDLFVLSKEEYKRQQKIVSTIGYAAKREGIVCYG